MKLSTLLEQFSELELGSEFPKEKLEKVNISYIRTDSRKVQDADIFCIPDSLGEAGLKYAFESKAKVILLRKWSSEPKIPGKIILYTPADAEAYSGKIASFLLGDPSKKIKVIGVTGTNGKTSLTHILYSLGQACGKSCGLIGTVGVKFGGKFLDTGYTTPDGPQLQEILKQMADSDIEYVFMEASSHGLKLGRTGGVDFSAGIFTNLTQDHLDFHLSMQDYLESKAILFSSMERNSNAFAVIDSESPGGGEMRSLISASLPKLRTISIGRDPKSLQIEGIEFSLQGTKYRIALDSKFASSAEIHTNLLGRFNVRNTALAFLTALELGWDKETSIKALRNIPQIPGRFEIYYSPDKSRMAVVDYAHTPDALENILLSVRDSKPTELITLFGCGGDRDRTKRPKMAKIAEQLSDKVILTSDNPRTEDPDRILDEIEKGFSQDYKPILRERDRSVAIQSGIAILPAGGCLLVAGKGHENYQIIGREKRHFDDGEEIQKAWRFSATSR
ncbi:UDP-N-acetylmuramoyl-L-alanyl-D-glutamate--2,6-diaminopimelate ligase [Leptospira perolatii]|uniref:UDP-N-acetylmuramoyl-L-alanyl-D-glutamate--2,6-diaminopimelate ligase n=1 Tax=Leptospira perolatii TaxID=2023191 RepID=A0A2M9ZKG0_9LEPT|nr:UDP-N-acetylmuramoyl-L-alanyl-D-glutamate--2,6-diaminopimelate ligase [Leptospira perolatii]PJZ69393.1 UDP-N-acetylmuramoyl-L-alanyl-D-glutamate--2,6-diaminopimelate ligase [Leptospira perolatii]PJZ72528.1 UDP-N-acetylmuramoyl-L-alanyl-D-glutamate--2,6-diaminopimelate ligase [Leptospira perolatii]